MARAMKVSTKMIKRMVKAFISGRAEIYTKANTSTMKEVVKVPWSGPMAASMKENGTKAFNMVSAE